MRPALPVAAIHTDAANMGFDGTLNAQDLGAGLSGHGMSQGVCNCKD